MKHLKKFEAIGYFKLGEDVNPNSEIEEIKEVLDEMRDELDGFESNVIMYHHNGGYRVQYSIPNKLGFSRNGNIKEVLDQLEKDKKVMDNYIDLSNDALKRLDSMGYEILYYSTSHQVKGLSQSEHTVLQTVMGVKKK